MLTRLIIVPKSNRYVCRSLYLRRLLFILFIYLLGSVFTYTYPCLCSRFTPLLSPLLIITHSNNESSLRPLFYLLLYYAFAIPFSSN